jgi:hypothetical protein
VQNIRVKIMVLNWETNFEEKYSTLNQDKKASNFYFVFLWKGWVTRYLEFNK